MTTTMSPQFAIPLLVTLCTLTALRWIFVRDTVIQRRLNMMFASWSVVAILRDPHVQDLIAPHLTHDSLIRQFTHIFAMLGSAAMWGVADELRNGERSTRERQRFVYGIVLAMGLSLFLLSAPSRAAGETLEQHAGWIDVLYMAVYTAPTIAAVIYVAVVALGTLRDSSNWPTRLGMVALLGAVASQLVDATTRPLSAAVLATGNINAFTEWRANSNDSMFLPAATFVAFVMSWPVVTKLLSEFGWDPSSRAHARIQPMWTTLTTALPGVKFDEPGQTPQERADHAAIEVWDAMLQLRAYFVVPDQDEYAKAFAAHRVPLQKRTAVLICIGLQQACDAVRRGAQPLSDEEMRAATKVIDQTDMAELAKVWNVSLRISGASGEA
ncbi:DUF6545 domain-containing protein [Prescottella agglutinans]|uniref:DUF6545 domain-containing protein n=1 Tax=Prescottella agglutinans TaxID=1644129 RepID=A0ABT6MI11_9NOCA|nr:DUF6545 domain-containing protein [Prescottella agglutinans]MDH6283954.1 hypothetical protein [Prescottella agglutinans]